MNRMAQRLPSPVNRDHDDQDTQGAVLGEKSPTTLRAAVRVFSEVVQFSEQEHQEFWIAVEVEGALHNRTLFPDSTIDVVLIVDNA